MQKVFIGSMALLTLNLAFATRNGPDILSRAQLGDALIAVGGTTRVSEIAGLNGESLSTVIERSLALSGAADAANSDLPSINQLTLNVTNINSGGGNLKSSGTANPGSGPNSSNLPIASALNGAGFVQPNVNSGIGNSDSSLVNVVPPNTPVADVAAQPGITLPAAFVPQAGSDYSVFSPPASEGGFSDISQVALNTFRNGSRAEVGQIAADIPVTQIPFKLNLAQAPARNTSGDLPQPTQYQPIYSQAAAEVFGSTQPLANNPTPKIDPKPAADKAPSILVAANSNSRGNKRENTLIAQSDASVETSVFGKKKNSISLNRAANECSVVCSRIKNESKKFNIKVSKARNSDGVTITSQFKFIPTITATSLKWSETISQIKIYEAALKSCQQGDNDKIVVQPNLVTVGMRSDCYKDLQIAEREGIDNRWDAGTLDNILNPIHVGKEKDPEL